MTETNTYILGVDPGFKGALALYDPIKKICISIKDMPLMMRPNQKRNELDLQTLADFVGIYSRDIKLAAIEKVSAMTYQDKHGEIRGQGAAASFEFGRATGIVQGVVASYALPTILVAPASWKSAMGLSRNKQESLDKAKALFPSHRHYFLRKKDDGRAEALLLCVFVARYLKLYE
jgi:crossover junction endodeoxyribonuclease RuvC